MEVDGAARNDVAVLLGGCGDARHFFATLVDVGDPRRTPRPERGLLRFTLNDHTPEVIARVYVLLTLLRRAADALSSDVPPRPA